MNSSDRTIIRHSKEVYADFMGCDDSFRVRISKKTAIEMLGTDCGFTTMFLYSDCGKAITLVCAG